MNHTKGEWKISEEGSGTYKTGCLEIMHPTNKEICIALCYPTNPNMKEDARLIRAVPNLLKACKKAIIMLDDADWSKSDIEYKSLQQAINMAESR